MIPIFKIACIGAALLLIIALPLFYIFKNRKDQSLFKNLLYGLITYFLTTFITNVFALTIFKSIATTSNTLTYGAMVSISNAVSFVVATYVVVTFLNKKGNTIHPTHFGLGFLMLIILAKIPELLNYFMFSFAINSNSLATAVEGITPEQVQSITKFITDASPVFFLNYFASRFFEFAVYSLAALCISNAIKSQKLVQGIAVALVVIVALYFIPSLLITYIPNDIVVLLSQAMIGSLCFVKLKPWLSNS